MEDLFDALPYMLVVISEDDHNRIETGKELGESTCSDIEILHVCLYEASPTADDATRLYNRLMTNEEFGLLDTPLRVYAPPPEVKEEIVQGYRTGLHGYLNEMISMGKVQQTIH